MNTNVMKGKIGAYKTYLAQEERSASTISQYERDIYAFLLWAEEGEVTKDSVICYKNELQEQYKAASVNAKLAALNSFFNFLDRSDLRVKQLRLQRQTYCAEDKELTQAEYQRLVKIAERKNNERLSLMIQTICGTGIRVSELQFFTVEAVKFGEVTVKCKNKTRTILIPGKLRKQLKDYAKRNRIEKGVIFCTRTGKPIGRSHIWLQMKKLCRKANVNPAKVFPHNLRKLFARTFYKLERDIAKLADILGHTSIDTTRIYIMTTGAEHRCLIERMGLVL